MLMVLATAAPSFDFDVIARSWRYLLFEGMAFTLWLTLLATVGGVIVGTAIALMRLSGRPVLSRIALGYTTVFRSLPLVLVIFWCYFLLPYVVFWLTGTRHALGPFNSALITFTLFEAAFFAEIIRAGIQSIPVGQTAAASALGLSYPQVMATVVLPQAFRNMIPVLLTQIIVLFQDTSLVYVISLTDFLGAASKVGQRDGRLVEMYVFAAVVYFTISFALSRVVAQSQARGALRRTTVRRVNSCRVLHRGAHTTQGGAIRPSAEGYCTLRCFRAAWRLPHSSSAS
jgi:glutamate/aspartate transport system permease protein